MGKMENTLAEALGRAHAALLKDLRQLQEAARSGSGESLTEFRVRLDATHTHLTEHFRFEEQNGYLDAVRKREPRLERMVQQLAEEHRELAQDLDALRAEARAATSLEDRFPDKVRHWVERVRQHELRENDLVQDAFNLDLSAED
jgi:hypothetical protein